MRLFDVKFQKHYHRHWLRELETELKITKRRQTILKPLLYLKVIYGVDVVVLSSVRELIRNNITVIITVSELLKR